jgi:predicted nucleic acid-binding protein
VFVDSDVLLDVAAAREPWRKASAAVLDGAQRGNYNAFVSWHALANVYYCTPTKQKQSIRGFIRALLGFARVAPVGTEDMLFALDAPLADLEDAMQVAAAVACRARHIVTRNTRHFKKSAIPAITPKAFLAQVSS